MIGKRVIWAAKQRKNIPNIIHFKEKLKDYLLLLKCCHVMCDTSASFVDQWDTVLHDLLDS